MKLLLYKIKFALAIGLVICSHNPVQAESNRSTLIQNLRLRRQLNSPIFAAPKPPKGTGQPGRRDKAGSRGCDRGTNISSNVKKRFAALVPFYSKSELVYGVTSKPYPSLSFYIPYKSDIAYGEFVLEDEETENQQIYKVALTETPGIVNLQLSSGRVPLQIGKQQRWYFNIYCKDDNRIIANLEGDIKREQIKSALESQLETATPTEKIKLYGAKGFWFEALNNAIQVRRSNPRDTSLQKLLQEIGLKDVANEPIVDCCKLQKEE